MEWIKIKDRVPKGHADAFKVITEDGEELKAYFYRDKMQLLEFYGKKPTHWWSAKTHQPLYNVTYWFEHDPST